MLDHTIPKPPHNSGEKRAKIFKRDKSRCRYCGVFLRRRERTIDHVVPKVRGGSSEASNLVTSCGPCNWDKHNRTPEEAGMVLLPVPEESEDQS